MIRSFIVLAILFPLYIAPAIAHAAQPKNFESLTGAYSGADKSVAFVKSKLVKQATVFEKAEYRLIIVIESQNENFSDFSGKFEYDEAKERYFINTDLECDNPGCYFYTNIEVNLDPVSRKIDVSFEGYITAEGDEEEKYFSGSLKLARMYEGIVKKATEQTRLRSKRYKGAVYRDLKESVRWIVSDGSSRLISSKDETKFEVLAYVKSGDEVEGIYVESFFKAEEKEEDPAPASCISIVVKGKVKYSTCTYGKFPIGHLL